LHIVLSPVLHSEDIQYAEDVMRRSWARLALLMAIFAGCTARNPQTAEAQRTEVVLLTTTSAKDSGLLDVIRPVFEQQAGYRLKVIAHGTGAALKEAAQGEGDVVLTHDPEAEKRWLAEGNGTSRRLVMYNDFLVVGPKADPAGIRGKSAVEAFRKIAAAKAAFISRGDESGTHVRELSLWKKAGITPKGEPWYQEAGRGQRLTLEVASEKQAYALTDRGTFLVHEKRLELVAFVENEPLLLNLYHVMQVNPQKFPKANTKGGQVFAEFLLSPAGQKLIGEFGKDRFAQSLFIPAADRTEDELLKP
jgi:tungstate transport system substrate-binding protein